ncbi:hypothetical protein CAEBREN_22012 [Caenorhabditis brenneri]|uniref:MADF domain-containing protein n=1 Tax=Caenorhabditis brenneri TaxID=135651 RepID=G0NTK5_CAEBE|nr:hypothetical protein CAEBREN_22012 [Caenorhabditis brenneri]
MIITCITDFGYFDSPEFLALSMHVVTAISTPVHCIGLYCILFKTPEEMKSVKRYLLVLHVYIVLFDYSFGVLTIPYFLFPTVSGFPLGLLQKFGVPIMLQTVFTLNIFAYVCISIISVFENRFFTVCDFPHKKYWKFFRRPWLSAHYIYVFLGILRYAQLIPEQTREVIERVLVQLPCLSKSVYEAPIYVTAENDYTYIITAISIFIVIFTLEISFFNGFMVKSLLGQLKSHKMSAKTYQMQRRFFIALGIQMMFPLILFMLPIMYAIIMVVTSYHNQALVNILMTNASGHGLVSTTVMIIVHRPYRVTVLGWIGKKRLFKRPKVSDRQVSQIIYDFDDIVYFLSEVEENPILYDSSVDNCHRKEFLQKTFDRIEINCGKFMPRGKNSHGNTAKALWKQLLDAYNKYKKRVVSASSGSGISSLIEFPYAKAMEFIDTAVDKRQVENTYIIGSREHHFSEAAKAEDSITEKSIATMSLCTPKRTRSLDSDESPLFKKAKKDKKQDDIGLLMEQLRKKDETLLEAVKNQTKTDTTDRFAAVFNDHTKDWTEVDRYVAEAQVLSFIKTLKAPHQQSTSTGYSSTFVPSGAQYNDVPFSPSYSSFHNAPSTSSAAETSQLSDVFDWSHPGF